MTCCTFYFLSSQSIFHVTPAVVAAKKEVSLLEGLSYNLDPHDLIHSGSVRSDYWVILQFTSSPEYWGFFFFFGGVVRASGFGSFLFRRI